MADDFVDVDFTKEPQFVFGDLGAACFGSYKEFAAPIMSDAEINDWIEKTDAEGGGLDSLVVNIFDQGQEGSCVGNATTQAHQIKQAQQFGKDRVVKLSAISLYKQIGRSAQSGAVVSDAMAAIEETGILPLDTPENRAKYASRVMPPRGFGSRWPDSWRDTAKLFRGVEFNVIRSTAALYTACCQGHPVIVGRQGHSICYVRPTMKNGRRVFKYCNSWGNWGDAGYGYDTESQVKMSASWAFAIRSVNIPE